MVANAFALLQPYLLGRGVDAVTRHQAGRLPLIFLAVLAAAAGDAAFRFTQRLTINRASRQIENELRRDLFQQLLRLDQRFFQQIRTGDLMARATNDLSAVQNLLGMGLMNIANTLVIFVAAVTLMALIDWQLTILSVSLLTLLSLGFLLLGPQIQKRFLKVQQEFAAVSSKAQENFSGIRVVKAYVQEEHEERRFRQVNQDYVRANVAWARINSALWPLFGLLAGLAGVVLLYVGGQHVVQQKITIGQFIQFNTYLILLSWPMIALGWVANMFQQGAASMGRIEEVLHQQPAIAGAPNPVTPAKVAGEIIFDRVTFAYEGAPIFQDLSLRVPAGSTLAIVGSTGSGKSTLVRLLTRVYDPQSGRILLDGTDIRDIPLDFLRRQVGYVPQEAFLFSETLAENITLGAPNAPAEAVRAAAQRSQLSADLRQFPQGFNTMIGERGVTLSGGQKQRTAIARALIKDPRVLVLDDALSSVDTRTEEEILNGLREFMEGRTSLVIAHRVSTVKSADRIVVLDEGRIVEQGTHTELLTLGGEYARLLRAPAAAPRTRGGGGPRRRLPDAAMSVRGGHGARWAGASDEVLGKAYDARLMRRLWTYVRPHRMLGVIGLVLLLLSSLNDLAGPYFTQQAIDHYIRPGRLNGYGKLAALWTLVIVLNFGARYWQSFAMNLLGQRVMFDLRNAVFSHLQRMSLSYFDHTPVGVLVTRMTNDVDALNQLLTSGLVAVIGDLFSLVVIAGFLLWVNWRMALIVFLIMPVVVAITAVMRTQMRDTYRAIRTRIGRINGFLQEAVSGVLTIQLFNRERRSLRGFRPPQPRLPEGQPEVGSAFLCLHAADELRRFLDVRADPLDRRGTGGPGSAHTRHAGSLPAAGRSSLPADSRSLREVQHPAGRDGRLRAHLRHPRRARPRSGPGHGGQAAGAAGLDRPGPRLVRLPGGRLGSPRCLDVDRPGRKGRRRRRDGSRQDLIDQPADPLLRSPAGRGHG